MAATLWWVGAYIEGGMSLSGGKTPYLAFAFSAPTKAGAQANAGAKLLAGPFSTEGAAQKWAGDYNTNPATVQAGAGTSKSNGTTTAGKGAPPGAGLIANAAGGTGFHLSFGNTSGLLTRTLKVVLGMVLIVGGVSKLAGVSPVSAAGKVASGIFPL